jgi:hypothetical protein
VRWARLSERAHLSAAGLSIGAKSCSSAGQYKDGVAGRDNEGADILRVAGSDPVARVRDRDNRGVDGIASAGTSQKDPRTLPQSTVHRPDVDRTK